MVDKNIGTLTTPEEYIDHYYTLVKDKLKTRGLQISRVGFVGFFLHLLGYTQYDAKQYYDTLFREAFLATADDEENLNLHASIYGYDPFASNPATLVGNLRFYTESVAPSSGVKEFVITGLTCSIGNVQFVMESTYTIIGNACEIKKSSGEIIHVPYDSNNGLIPLNDFYQYSTDEIFFTLPHYVYGTYYQKIIDIPDESGTIYDIEVLIRLRGEEEYEAYETRRVKYFTGASEMVVFYREIPGNQIAIEFGSGIHAKYVPDAEVSVKLKLTHGSLGNISQNTSVPQNGKIRIFNTTTGTSFTQPAKAVDIEIDYADGGTDKLEKDDLRSAIIKHIQTRDNLLSEQDFYNILETYLFDFILLFKKTNVIENTIYLFMPFRDKYLYPILSKSISVVEDFFNPIGNIVVFKPTFDIGGVVYISPFIYIFDDYMRHYKGYVYFENFSTYFSSIQIEEVGDATVSSALPLSLAFQYKPGSKSTRIIAQSYSDISTYVMYIRIPALGIYECMDVYDDNNHEWYYVNIATDGIIKDCIDISIEVFSAGIHILTYSVNDVCVLGDVSDILTLKLYENPPDSTFGMSGGIGDSTWIYTGGSGVPPPVSGDGWYLPQTGQSGYTGGAVGDDTIGDKPVLAYITLDSYIINIPVMLEDVYLKDYKYFDSKFLSSLSRLATDENRMISDDVQIRFLNTEIIPSNILKALTLQAHDFEILLPLVLDADIAISKTYLIENDLDLNQALDDLQSNLAVLLNDEYSGVDVAFYRTQIVDVIHNLDWVKHCNVKVYDSSAEPKEIPDANLELADQRLISGNLDKFAAVTFCPIYIWWNLDNINLNITYE